MATATKCKVMGVLKADAYGHGAVPVAHMLYRCNKVDFFAVATINEAIELRMSDIPGNVHILVLGATHRSEWLLYSQYYLDMTVNSAELADEVIQWTKEAR